MWILITGTLRSEMYLALILKLLNNQKYVKVIDGIVISTWHDNAKSVEDIIKNSNNKIKMIIVESSPPLILKPVTSSFTSMNYQYKAIYEGLQFIPENSIVLKTRTDRSFNKTKQFLDYYISNKNIDKIVVSLYSNKLPFGFDDMVFMTSKKYLISLIDFSIHNFMNTSNTQPQLSLFGSPLRLKDAIVNITLDCMDFNLFHSSIKEVFAEAFFKDKNLALAIIRFYYRYYKIIKDHIEIVNNYDYKSKEIFHIATIIGFGYNVKTLIEAKGVPFSYLGSNAFYDGYNKEMTDLDRYIYKILEEIKDEELNFKLINNRIL